MESVSSMEFVVPVGVAEETMWKGAVSRGGGRCPYPELVPEVFASVEGPWVQLGSVLRLKFNNGLRDCKWTVTGFDPAAHKATWTWLEEEGPMAMRPHTVSLLYVATGADSCSLHFSMHFDGKVDAEYAQALKETFTKATLLMSSRLTSSCQPN